MAGKAVLPAEFSFFGRNKLIYGIRAMGRWESFSLGNKKPLGPLAWNQYCVRISRAFLERMAYRSERAFE